MHLDLRETATSYNWSSKDKERIPCYAVGCNGENMVMHKFLRLHHLQHMSKPCPAIDLWKNGPLRKQWSLQTQKDLTSTDLLLQ